MNGRNLDRARQRFLRSTARNFAHDVLLEHRDAALDALDPGGTAAPRTAYERMVGEGFLRVCLPERVGGESRALTDTATVLEELHRGDARTALALLHTVVGLQPVITAGSRAQQARLLAPFLRERGAPVAAFCAGEPGGSHDGAALIPAAGLHTSAVLDGDQWVIEGRKNAVATAPGWDGTGADLLCVLCYTNPLAEAGAGATVIAVEGPAAGVTCEQVPDGPGRRAQHAAISFDHTPSAYDNAIGDPGRGLAVTTHAAATSAALVGVVGVALARAALEQTLSPGPALARRRGVSPSPSEDPAVGRVLADAETRIEAARALSWRACAAIDAAHPTAPHPNIPGPSALDPWTVELAGHAERFGTTTAVDVITDLLDVLGHIGVDTGVDTGTGSSNELSHALRRLRHDALVLPVSTTALAVRPRVPHELPQRRDDHLAFRDVV